MNNWRFTLTVIAATTAIIGTAQAVTDTAFKYSTAKTGYFTKGFKPFPVEWLTVELPARSRIVGIDMDSRGEKSPDG